MKDISYSNETGEKTINSRDILYCYPVKKYIL